MSINDSFNERLGRLIYPPISERKRSDESGRRCVPLPVPTQEPTPQPPVGPPTTSWPTRTPTQPPPPTVIFMPVAPATSGASAITNS